MEKISVVITTYNSEHTIRRCLSSVRWADELIVVDSSSSDRTVAVARTHTDSIYPQPNNPMLNVNKNFGFSIAKGNWILSLDSDEEIPPPLADEIRAVVRDGSTIDGYWLPRKNIIFGKWIRHGLWWPDKQLRLFRRGRGSFPCRHVHEYLHVEGATGDLTQPFIHHNYDSIAQFIRKMESVYTESEVNKLTAMKYTVYWFDALRFPISDFVKIYFAQEGYKDGLHGLVLSLLQSFYSFIVFAKMWERRGFNETDIALVDVVREMGRQNRTIHYWQLSARIKASRSPLGTFMMKVWRRYVATV